MIERLEIASLHYKLDKPTHEFIIKKLSPLDKYMPRHARQSAHMEVKIKGPPGRGKKVFTCEVVLHLPKGTLAVHELDSEILTAIDRAENKLKAQLSKYKQLHANPRLHRRLIKRIKNSPESAEL